MKRIAWKLAAVLLIGSGTIHAAQTAVQLSIDPEAVVNRIDEKVYGHFLEHIYHSCHGGLWGDLIWNRSFEQNELGHWMVQDNQIAQKGMGTNVRLTFGEVDWQNYEYTLEAKKTGGQEGFLILFRVKNEKEFYWCNLGGWNNQRHALEKGLATASRWGTVGPQPSGRIESDQWYRIKVRCEERRFQVWLNEKLIIDYTDNRRAHLNGKVGVGTWATQAVYRNLKVQALDGTVLYEGLPDSLTQQNVGSFWKTYGGVRAYVDRTNPLNSEVCQKIVTDSSGGGLQQEGLCIRSQQVYEGSLWLKGKAQDLVVQLRGDAGQETTARIGIPSASSFNWREIPFTFAPDWSSDNAALRLGVKGVGEVWIDQVSMMPKSWKEQGGFRPDLLQAVADLRPPVIRWPGGCFASSYQWKQGIGPQHKRLPHPREIWDDLDVYNFGTDEFIEMCRRVGAEPLIVVNIGSQNWNSDADTHDYLQDILDWIEYCNGPADSQWGKVRRANGHPEPYNVKYWEIDNETWHLPAEAYAEQVLEIAPLMKKVDPSIRLIACGSGGMGRNNNNGMRYNRIVIERCAHVLDYLSIHHYENPNRYAEGPKSYEAFFREIGELIRQSSNPKLKIYVSEWNAQSTDWRTGLYCGGLLNAFERCGDILEIGGPALFLRHVSATAWDNAFINFDQSSWFPAPNYQVMKLWREHFAPERVALLGDTGPLNVVATRRDAGATTIIKIVNPTREDVPVQMQYPEQTLPATASAQMVAPGSLEARNTLSQPDRLKVENLPVRIDGAKILVELPPLSAVVLTVATTK
jgi:alpha-L-arabinofuranosidase